LNQNLICFPVNTTVSQTFVAIVTFAPNKHCLLIFLTVLGSEACQDYPPLTHKFACRYSAKIYVNPFRML